jgi:hypothetical protein
MSIKPFSADDCANALLWIAPQLAATLTERELVRCLAALLFANHAAYEALYGPTDRERFVAYDDVLDCQQWIRSELQRRRSNAAVERRAPYVDIDRARDLWCTIGGNLYANGTDHLDPLADGPAADKLLRLVWPLARRVQHSVAGDEYLCGCGCVFGPGSVHLGARLRQDGFGTCHGCVKEIARQRAIVAERCGDGFGIIGRLWHTLLCFTWEVRFAPTGDLDEQTIDGMRWQPVVAVMPPTRAREILEQARERATIGPWADHLDKVMTPAERAMVNAVLDDMPGEASFVHALWRIAEGR